MQALGLRQVKEAASLGASQVSRLTTQFQTYIYHSIYEKNMAATNNFLSLSEYRPSSATDGNFYVCSEEAQEVFR